MFDQTFVPVGTSSRNPVSFTLSLLLQCSALALLLLFTLLTGQRLPSAQIRSILLAPKPPIAIRSDTKAVPEATVASQPARHTIVFSHFASSSPRVSTPPAVDLATAPDLASISGTPNSNAIIDSSTLPQANATRPIPLPEPQIHPQLKPGVQKVSEGVAAANLLHKVVPDYPQTARAARVEGTVRFHAVINEQGEITQLQLVSGHPLLVNAARQAVLQWRFRPTLLNGVPVSVITDISVNFRLGTF